MFDAPKSKKELDKYILEKYQNLIHYYWFTSGSNKRTYKRIRAYNIIIGALVTLTTTLLSVDYIQNNETLNTGLLIVSPLLAVLLTIMNGFSSGFPFAAAWRDGVVAANTLEKMRDEYIASSPKVRNPRKELGKINAVIENETKSFFKQLNIHDKQYESTDKGNTT